MAVIRKFVVLLLMLLTSCGDDSRVVGLIEAARYGDVGRMSRLIDEGADVNGVAMDGEWTPLTQAAYAGQLEAVKLLLTRGADINKGVVTPLRWAIFHGHLRVAMFLVERGAQLNLDPAAKANFIDHVSAYKSDELMNLLTEIISRENSSKQ